MCLWLRRSRMKTSGLIGSNVPVSRFHFMAVDCGSILDLDIPRKLRIFLVGRWYSSMYPQIGWTTKFIGFMRRWMSWRKYPYRPDRETPLQSQRASMHHERVAARQEYDRVWNRSICKYYSTTISSIWCIWTVEVISHLNASGWELLFHFHLKPLGYRRYEIYIDTRELGGRLGSGTTHSEITNTPATWVEYWASKPFIYSARSCKFQRNSACESGSMK